MDRSIRRVDNVRMKADSSIITRRGLKTIGSKGTTTGFSMMMNSYARTLNEIAKFCPKTIQPGHELRGFWFQKKPVHHEAGKNQKNPCKIQVKPTKNRLIFTDILLKVNLQGLKIRISQNF